MGKPIIMGRKTYESIGKPLPGRENIVITGQADYAPPGVHVVAGVNQALSLGAKLAASADADEICVIGGAEIYQQTLPCADRIYLSQVHINADGDAHFPPLDKEQWREVAHEFVHAGANDDADYSFIIYDRVSHSVS